LRRPRKCRDALLVIFGHIRHGELIDIHVTGEIVERHALML
jgi:hypothetical protein